MKNKRLLMVALLSLSGLVLASCGQITDIIKSIADEYSESEGNDDPEESPDNGGDNGGDTGGDNGGGTQTYYAIGTEEEGAHITKNFLEQNSFEIAYSSIGYTITNGVRDDESIQTQKVGWNRGKEIWFYDDDGLFRNGIAVNEDGTAISKTFDEDTSSIVDGREINLEDTDLYEYAYELEYLFALGYGAEDLEKSGTVSVLGRTCDKYTTKETVGEAGLALGGVFEYSFFIDQQLKICLGYDQAVSVHYGSETVVNHTTISVSTFDLNAVAPWNR